MSCLGGSGILARGDAEGAEGVPGAAAYSEGSTKFATLVTPVNPGALNSRDARAP